MKIIPPIMIPIIVPIITHMATDMSIGSKSEAATATFVFADLAGFTALTETHGDAEALEIVTTFVARVRALLPAYGGEEIKTIGDEVMIRVEDPVQALRLGLRIVHELAAPGSPPVRVGMHSGPAIARDGDWFGGTVNLASRVAGAAKAGEVLLTEGTSRQAGRPAGLELEERGTRYLRHLPEPVPVYRAHDTSVPDRDLEIDPVCRMAVDPGAAGGSRPRRGITYYFCSPECQELFEADPRRYLATSDAARAARKGFLINLTVFLLASTIHGIVWLFGGGHHDGPPTMLLFYAAWAVALVLHYRAVRQVL